MNKIIKKMFIVVLLIVVAVWVSVKIFLSSRIPDELMQDSVYWIMLLTLIVTNILYKFNSSYYLYCALLFFGLGGSISVFGFSSTSEFVLRFGFVFLLFGSILAFFSKE